jgi:CBS domain-containing protein
MDPAAFLRSHPPFDRLRPEEVRLAESALEIAYYPRGTRILQRGGPRSAHLYVIRKGAVRLERDGQLVQQLEEGDSFGFPSLIGRTSPHVDVLAAEDVLAYRFAEDAFQRLMASPRFAAFFMDSLSDRLRAAASADQIPSGRDLATPIVQLNGRPPLTVPRHVSVGDAARRMRDAGVSSVLVEGEPAGILTDRDLRGRVLAEGRGPETPVTDVMSSPVKTLRAQATLLEALLFMLGNRVHHVPIEDAGRITGMITDTDVLRRHVSSPVALRSSVEKLERPADLAGYATELAGVIEALAWGGLEAAEIGRIVSHLNDAVVRRLLALAEADLGPPPCAYAWIVFGSEGRMEQALLTDQDNALVYADERGPEADGYFARLTQRVVDDLAGASFPLCRGGFMATNWRRPLSAWTALFHGWITRPEPRALLEAANFFDFRAVHGGLDLAPLEAVLAGSGREPLFLAHLARAALTWEPPLGLLRTIKETDGGVDLKRGGLIAIVGLARVYALEAGSTVRPTLERLAAAAAAGTLSADGAATLGEAFRFLLRVRLRAQLRKLRAGETPDNRVPLEDLSALERSHLKDTFVAIRQLQEATALRFATARLA